MDKTHSFRHITYIIVASQIGINTTRIVVRIISVAFSEHGTPGHCRHESNAIAMPANAMHYWNSQCDNVSMWGIYIWCVLTFSLLNWFWGFGSQRYSSSTSTSSTYCHCWSPLRRATVRYWSCRSTTRIFLRLTRGDNLNWYECFKEVSKNTYYANSNKVKLNNTAILGEMFN